MNQPSNTRAQTEDSESERSTVPSIPPRRELTGRPGISSGFELGCEGKGCDANSDPSKKGRPATFGRRDSYQIIQDAHARGFSTDEKIEAYILETVRAEAYQAGWTVGRVAEDAAPDDPGQDYCPDCMKSGRCPGDKRAVGAGRRRMKRSGA
ncbi:MAG: hypothetical protein V3R34_08845 [Hyphomicrobium sp.]